MSRQSFAAESAAGSENMPTIDPNQPLKRLQIEGPVMMTKRLRTVQRYAKIADSIFSYKDDKSK